MSIESLALGFAITTQALAFVWGAAKMHSAVKSLEDTSDKFNETLTKIADRVNEHGEAIAALRARWN